MKQKCQSAIVAALMCGGMAVVAAPAPVYENRETVSNPVIDATVFLNRGTFIANSFDQPYDTQNTLFYTNFAGAVIRGAGGFQFDLVGTNGFRRPAASFVNGGSVRFGEGNSGLTFDDTDLGNIIFFGAAGNSWILVNATNIQNRGGLSVGPGGRIELKGETINLARSGIRAGEDPSEPIQQGSEFGDVLYSNDDGVGDLYWGVGQNNSLDPAAAGPFNLAVLAGSPPNSGFHEVLVASGLTNRVIVPPFGNAPATNIYVVTNALSPTNWVVQVVYVNTNSTDPQFKIDVKFGTPRIGDVPGAKMPIVRWTFEDIDTITAEPYTNYVYLLDSLGALTNSILTTNISTRSGQRPSNFIVTRVTPPEWAAATGTNAAYTPDLIVNPNYAGATVTNWYSGYRASIGTSSSGTGGSGGFFGGQLAALSHPTNQPGRVEIIADQLDLSLARFRTDGLLSIKAADLVGTEPYKLDSAVVSMDVGRRGSPLVVSNLVQPIVRRFNGVVSAWSGIWTNTTTVASGEETNTVEIRFHALVVGHQFVTRQPVETLQFSAEAATLRLNDSLTVSESFVARVPDVDLAAAVSFGGNPVTPAAFPGLVNLTNRVGLTTQVGFTLGNPTNPVRYIENRGRMSGSTMDLYASSLWHSGTLASSVGDLVVDAGRIVLSNATVSAVANLLVTADSVDATLSQLSAGYQARNPNTGNTNYFPGAIFLDVSERLADGGPAASNRWAVYDGIHLVRKPAAGDLLGTTITSKAAQFAEVVHTWAGEDRGNSPSGFNNNAAIGTLVLDGRQFSLFTFRAPGASPAAMYVDYLQLTNSATNLLASLNIEPGMTLYVADSNLSPDTWDGAFDGRLRWASNYVGGASSATVDFGGTRVAVNRALLMSLRIDSDGDGIPNGEDATPFASAPMRVSARLLRSPAGQIEVSWTGTAAGRYRVEYLSNLTGGTWRTLTSCEAPADAPGAMSVCDTEAGADEQRFYRVVQER